MRIIIAFLRGMRAYRRTIMPCGLSGAQVHAYELGQDLMRRLTLRHYAA